MMSLLTRFALLSSIIYCALPDARLMSADGIATAGAHFARTGIAPVSRMHVSHEMQGFGKLIGFNPHGFENLKKQLAQTALPTPAQEARATKRLTQLFTNARQLIVQADQTTDVMVANLHELINDRAVIERARRSLVQINLSAQTLRQGAQNLGAN